MYFPREVYDQIVDGSFTVEGIPLTSQSSVTKGVIHKERSGKGGPENWTGEGRGRPILDLHIVLGKLLFFPKPFEKFSSLNYRKHHLLQSIHRF